MVFALATVVLLTEPAWACPTCKDSIAHGPNAGNLVQGYFWSIMFMMSMPFFILSGVGGYFYWEVRRARTRTSVAVEPVPLADLNLNVNMKTT